MHNLILVAYYGIVLGTLVLLIVLGYDYYSTSIEERYFHELNNQFKASGIYGHGFGIIGSLLIVIGVFSYMIRKRVRRYTRIGYLRDWLHFHIFLCVEGSILIVFHTTFKFGGLVAISFWSMVAVVLSGVVGRYIYLQIPRTIEGREMSRMEMDDENLELNKQIRTSVVLDENLYQILDENTALKVGFLGFLFKSKVEKDAIRNLKNALDSQQISKSEKNKILNLFKKQLALKKRIVKLVGMQNLLKYWHVAHLPFALIMLIIMVIHVAVALVFGYVWIFS
ncbi:MAG: hypothetical protein PF541_09490 [Prolixibacteraceae bacterium]|nr:hypothetical protein [Prolixibacteraceae bacterium]